MEIVKHNNFNRLIDSVYQTHCLLQQNAQKAVNQNLTMRNWLIGCYIVEFEQNGEDRAQYGAKLFEEMTKRIKAEGIKGLDARTLRSCRTFYIAYPQIWGTLSPKLQIQQSEPIGVEEEYPVSSELLLSRLSFSHFVEILRRDDPLERLFYEVETIKNNWSVREDVGGRQSTCRSNSLWRQERGFGKICYCRHG